MKRLLHINSPIDTKKGLEEIPQDLYFLIPYFNRYRFRIASCSSGDKLFMNAFHPGQKRVCQCQKRANSDFGFVSYRFRKRH